MIPAIILYVVLLHILQRYLLAAPSNPALWSSQALVLVIIFISGPACVLALEVFPVGVRRPALRSSIISRLPYSAVWLPRVWMADRAHRRQDGPIYYVSACMLLTLIGLIMLPPRAKEEPAISADLPAVRA